MKMNLPPVAMPGPTLTDAERRWRRADFKQRGGHVDSQFTLDDWEATLSTVVDTVVLTENDSNDSKITV
jgi:hypothetical protein